MSKRHPLVLAILDGWGVRADTHGNAIAAATLPNWTRMLERYPATTLEASGEAVGLPAGVMGNSEVGHINIGSGRVVPQGLVVIDDAIADGSFATNPVLQQCIAHVKASGGTLHLFGLLSDGRVHSSLEHIEAIVGACARADAAVAIDAFLDGRDTPPRSAQAYIDRIQAALDTHGKPGRFTSICGRYYAMDRDKRWERVEKAYALLARADAPYQAPTASDALAAAYARDENDEFVLPTIIGEPKPVADGDAVIFFNFRPDRGRELTLAFSAAHFEHFKQQRFTNLTFATMTRYEDEFPNPILFGPRPQSRTFGEIIAEHGLSQLRLAETEKYAHVTYFFNGGREAQFTAEDRVLIPSNRSVATYDLAPEMSASDITSTAVEDIAHGHHDVIVMNYANADMVGHTGVWEATISAVETIDQCLGRLDHAVRKAGGILAITADHGNAEEERDAGGNIVTSHTTNPVPFVLVSDRILGTLAPGGRLGDIAPTLLPLLGLPVPPEMTGTNLLAAVEAPA
jgi:2,3-bisphosphoglycerate-independent phosphoglycerate mutase